MSFETDTRIDMINDWVAIFPSPMDGWIQSALSGFENLLFEIAGNPDDLSRLHTLWTDEATGPGEVAQSQAIDRVSILQSWGGPARTTFDTNMQAIEEELPILGENFAALAGLLKDSGEAAIATVNAIVDMLLALLAWALAEAFVAIASSIITFGGSIAAWFASTAAKFGIATARITALIARLESILISVLAAIEGVTSAITLARTAGAIGLLALKTVPDINKAHDTATGLS